MGKNIYWEYKNNKKAGIELLTSNRQNTGQRQSLTQRRDLVVLKYAVIYNEDTTVMTTVH